MKLPPNDCLSLEEINFSGYFVCLFVQGWGTWLVFWRGQVFLFVCFLFGRDTEPDMFLPNEKQEEIVWYLKSICSLQKGERPSYSPGHVRNGVC